MTGCVSFGGNREECDECSHYVASRRCQAGLPTGPLWPVAGLANCPGTRAGHCPAGLRNRRIFPGDFQSRAPRWCLELSPPGGATRAPREQDLRSRMHYSRVGRCNAAEPVGVEDSSSPFSVLPGAPEYSGLRWGTRTGPLPVDEPHVFRCPLQVPPKSSAAGMRCPSSSSVSNVSPSSLCSRYRWY